MPDCHLRCDTCKSQVVANSLEQCLDKIICSQDGGVIDDTCRIALKVNGKPVYSIQKINNTDNPTKIGGVTTESINKSKKKK